MAALRLLQGGRDPRGPVLHPRSPLARRAGIAPIAVPADLWVSPALVAAMRPERLLRAVA